MKTYFGTVNRLAAARLMTPAVVGALEHLQAHDLPAETGGEDEDTEEWANESTRCGLHLGSSSVSRNVRASLRWKKPNIVT